MNQISIDELVEKGIIDQPFDYSFLEENLKIEYSFFDKTFQNLFREKAELFGIPNTVLL